MKQWGSPYSRTMRKGNPTGYCSVYKASIIKALTRRILFAVMSLLFNMLSRLVIAFLPRRKHFLISWLQSPYAVILKPPQNKVSHYFHCFPIYLPWSDGNRCHDLFYACWVLSQLFHSPVSLSSRGSLVLLHFLPTLPTMVRLVKAMVFPGVIYGCESWTMEKANALANWCEELTHWIRPWCWERMKAGGEGDDRGWDGWMALPTWWAGVWASSGNWWWTGKPGVLQSMESQRVRHDWATERLNWTDYQSCAVMLGELTDQWKGIYVFRERPLVSYHLKSLQERICLNAEDQGSIPGLGTSPGGGHGNPLQYSRLENPMDRGAWWATVHEVPKSWMWLNSSKEKLI